MPHRKWIGILGLGRRKQDFHSFSRAGLILVITLALPASNTIKRIIKELFYKKKFKSTLFSKINVNLDKTGKWVKNREILKFKMIMEYNG